VRAPRSRTDDVRQFSSFAASSSSSTSSRGTIFWRKP
jgi:hypothetical protein